MRKRRVDDFRCADSFVVRKSEWQGLNERGFGDIVRATDRADLGASEDGNAGEQDDHLLRRHG